jgi:hypothetical protein
MKPLPSKGMCLWLSQMYWEMRPSTASNRRLSWDYLMCWAAHEDWIA